MKESGKTVLIANPRSCWGRGRRVISQAVRYMRSRGVRFSFHTTKHPGHAKELARDVSSQADTIIVAGGDGTINGVLNGICSGDHERLPRIGIVAAGSSNDVAKSLHIPLSPRAACETILTDRTQAIDIGCINGHYFAMASTVGLFATIAAESNKLKGLSGARRYVAASLKTIAVMPDPWQMTVRTDSETYEGQFGVLLINNVGRYGGLPFQPKSDPTDGLLNGLLIPPVTRAQAISLVPWVVRGRLPDHPRFITFTTANLSIQLDRPAPGNNDGESLPELPTEITYSVLSRRIEIFR